METRPIYILSTRDLHENKRYIQTDSITKDGKRDFMKMKKSWVAIVVLDKIDFKTKTITIDKKEYYIMIKGAIQ